MEFREPPDTQCTRDIKDTLQIGKKITYRDRTGIETVDVEDIDRFFPDVQFVHLYVDGVNATWR